MINAADTNAFKLIYMHIYVKNFVQFPTPQKNPIKNPVAQPREKDYSEI